MDDSNLVMDGSFIVDMSLPKCSRTVEPYKGRFVKGDKPYENEVRSQSRRNSEMIL